MLKRMKGFKGGLTILAWLLVQVTFAEVRLPAVFGSHMVLQRRKPVPVWGTATSGEKITVTLASQTKTVKAGKDGRWRTTLDPMEAGGPYQLVVKGPTNTVAFDDVLLGEVWVCSGQSNMEWPLRMAANGEKEIRTANFPQIRQLGVKKAMSLTPKADLEAEWTVCSPETVPNYTAVGYFFAKQLQKELNVPIGLINTSWGGTHSETWTSRAAFEQDSSLRVIASRLPATYEEVTQRGRDRLLKLIQDRQGGLPTAADEQIWAKPDLDASSWKSMNVPADWAGRGLPVLDGVVWFRREVIVPEGTPLAKATLRFGSVDDRDSTYVNGQLVGSSKGLDPRAYVLPEGLLKPGRNVIAVRVVDEGGAGGFMGDPEKMRLSIGNTDLPLQGAWQYRVAHVFASSYKPGPNSHATQLFNAMLNPLIPYAIQGVIWYQGESNAGRAYEYRKSFPLMIRDWRQHWGDEFPFLFVQLASFNSANGNSRQGSTWAELREAQTMALKLPKTGMAVTSDIGDRDDIHPRNKLDVGLRLAAEAMRVAYGDARAVSQGPMVEGMTVAGNRAELTFRNTGAGLMAKDRYGYVRGFEVAGADQKFYYAKAEIKGNAVIVQSDSVAVPVAVRYGWADDNGDVNLYNREGFPAVPFRTDTWKGITEAAKFENQ